VHSMFRVFDGRAEFEGVEIMTIGKCYRYLKMSTVSRAEVCQFLF
jgi:hypothetical protein